MHQRRPKNFTGGNQTLVGDRHIKFTLKENREISETDKGGGGGGEGLQDCQTTTQERPYTHCPVKSLPRFLIQIIVGNKNSLKKNTSNMIYYDSDRNISKSL